LLINLAAILRDCDNFATDATRLPPKRPIWIPHPRILGENPVKRRELLLAAAFLLPGLRRAAAQQPSAKKRIAFVSASARLADIKRDPLAAFFDAELKRAGIIEGENVTIDRYSAEGQSDRYETVAREAVATNPDLIYTGGTPMTLKLKAATNTIPIVTMTGDPIRFGIVPSLAHPGGNITGVSVDAGVEVWGKRLSLLSQAVPNLKRVAFVSTTGGWTGPGGRAVVNAAPGLGLEVTSVLLANPYNEAEYRRVLGSIRKDQFDGVMLSDENEHVPYRVLIAQLVQQIPFARRLQLSRPGGCGRADVVLVGPQSRRSQKRGADCGDTTWRQACRHAVFPGDQLRVGHQPEERKRTRS
jgi:putative tryptophan/tyrosine transport system substrate-binding protein